MHKITKYVRGLIVACMGALGLNAWAVEVGEEVSWSNLKTPITNISNAGKAQFRLCYQPSADITVGTMVKLTKIVIANRSSNDLLSPCLKLTVGEADYYTAAGSTAEEATAVNAPTSGDPTKRKLTTYLFPEEAQPTICVGTVYVLTAANAETHADVTSATCGASAIQNGSVTQTAGIWWNHTVSTDSNWQILCELTATVVSLPTMYTYTIGTGWDTEPQSLTADDVVIYTGEGMATLDRAIPGKLIIENGADVSVTASQITGTVMISSGATMTLTEGTLNRSQITNNGTIKIQGGTRDNPITINDNGGIGAVKITAGSVFKNAATGGNKVYTVTGEGPTSVFIMGSGQNWGMADGTAIRNCTVVVVEKEFWIEKSSFMDKTVNIETEKILHIGHGPTPNQSFEFGALCTTANIGNNDQGYNITINLNDGLASKIGGSYSRPLTVKGTGTLELNANCTGSVTIAEEADVTLTAMAGTAVAYVINGTLKTPTQIAADKRSTTVANMEVVETETETGYEYTLQQSTPVVAKIGEVGYETLAKAIEAVTAENKTITLCAPASDEIAIATGKDVIIDLNGNNITSPMSIKGNLKIEGETGEVRSTNIKVYGEEGDSSGHFDVSEATIVAPANTFTVFLLLKSAKVTDMPTATFKGDDRRIFVTGGTEGGYLATSDFTTDFSTEDGKKIFTAVIPATLDSGEGRIYVMSEAGEAWVTPTGSTTTITIHNLPSTIEKVYLPVDSSVITVTGQNKASVIPYFYDDKSKLTYDLSDVCVGLQEDGSYKVELDATKVTPVLTATVEDETTVAPFVVDESAVSLGVTSKPGLLYTLKRAANLTADYVAVQEVRATTETIRLTDTNKPEGQAFYKVAVGTKTTAAQ